jgi:hypothetical protein
MGLRRFIPRVSYAYVMGMLAAVVCCLVVIPYGLLCQYVMSCVSSRRDPRTLSDAERAPY